MIRITIPSPLFSYTAGQSQVEVEAGSLAQALHALDRSFPGLRHRVVDEQGRIRPHIRFFVNESPVTDLQFPLSGAEEVLIVAALSGG
jgi:sulfur-carrier protein